MPQEILTASISSEIKEGVKIIAETERRSLSTTVDILLGEAMQLRQDLSELNQDEFIAKYFH